MGFNSGFKGLKVLQTGLSDQHGVTLSVM